MHDCTESTVCAYAVSSVPAILPTLKDSYAMCMWMCVLRDMHKSTVLVTEYVGQGLLQRHAVTVPAMGNTPCTRLAVAGQQALSCVVLLCC